MKINCSYCNCSMEATDVKCPFCGGVNEKASRYSNQMEKAAQAKRQREEASRNSAQKAANYTKKAKRVVLAVYGAIAVLIFFTIIISVVVSSRNQVKLQYEREQQRLLKAEEEQRQKEEAEAEKKAYDEAVVAVNGIGMAAEKDRYYSIQVTDVVAYELNYDHNAMDWGYGLVSDAHLFDGEHRVAVQIKVKNYQEKVSIFGNPTSYMGLYVSDENDNSIVIAERDFLNGSSDDNYYSGGKKISDTKDFIDNYNSPLEKNQTMSWWVPMIVNEDSKEIVLHFDYNMSITVDNPCAK